MEPNIDPTLPAFVANPQITDQESLKLSELPDEMLLEILTRLEESGNTNTTSKLWYKTISVIYKNKLEHQIQEALDIIIPEIEELDKNDNKSMERSGNVGQVVAELKKVLSKREILDSRMQITLSHEKIKTNIVQILSKLTLDELGVILTKKNFTIKDGGYSYPLFEQLLFAARAETIPDKGKSFESITNYVMVTHNEEKIIQFSQTYEDKDDKDDFFNKIIDELLKTNNLDNIKTAIRLMSKLKENKFTYNENKYNFYVSGDRHEKAKDLIKNTFRTLINNGQFILVLKFSELINDKNIKKVFSVYNPQLLNGDFLGVAKDIIKNIKNDYYYYFWEEKKSLLYFCLKSLCLEGKIDEFFDLVDAILKKTSRSSKDITDFFGDDSICKNLIAKMPVKNLEQMRDRISQNSQLKNWQVDYFLNQIKKRIEPEDKA